MEAKGLLQRAVTVLRKYYSKISEQIKAEVSLAQSSKAGAGGDSSQVRSLRSCGALEVKYVLWGGGMLGSMTLGGKGVDQFVGVAG